MSKYLLSGLSLTGLSTGFVFYEKEYGVLFQEQEVIDKAEKNEEDPENLIEKVGLECRNGYCWPNKKKVFNVERDKKEENLALSYWQRGGRIKIHKGNKEYPGGFRFTIEGSKIPLRFRRNWIGIGDSALVLKEYENYGIKKDGEKYYLSRTKNSNEGKILELGLPSSCTLPETGEISCKVLHVEGVGFGKRLDAHVDGETSLTITEKTEDKSFGEGYKFTFTFPQDVTINERVIRAKSPTDFRLKRHEDGHLTLERAWENEKELLDKVGLECGADGNCSLKSGGTLKIKKAANSDFLNISDISPGKIKFYKDEDYFNGLRLQVEEGKIGDGDNTLEEFETYEIEERENEYYLLLKKNPEKRIEELLKYPSKCSLSSECDIPNERSLKAINFEGKDEGSLSLQEKTVKISVSNATEENYPVGRKFSITSTADLNISGSTTVRANAPTDFKLKRHDNGNLTLERAWASENDLAGKVGLSCGEDSNCSLKTNESLRIKKEGKDFKISTLDGGGKIKLSKDTSGYSNGLKFTIEDGKIGSGDNVLEEFETYEIKGSGNEYYLELKTKAEEQIKKLLNFPSECFTSSVCSISKEDKFKNINFEGKVESSISLGNKTVKITVSNAPDGDFPFSRKFTVTSPTKITISSSTVVNANSPTDFKLKKESDGSLSLVKAWSKENELIGKVGLKCTDDGNCSLKNGSIEVRKNGKKIEISNLDDGGGKIKLYKNSDNYSNSLKFAVEEKNIGTGEKTLEEFETYEIKEDRSKYYLGLKTSAEDEIKKLLNYPAKCSFSSTCEKLNENEVKAINFSGKDQNLMTLKRGQTVKITVSKTSETDFTLGRKFTIESSGDLSISSSNSLKANAPTEFKIKREGTGQSTNLSLEKAWDLKTLTAKVGLDCSGDENNCTINSQNLNVKKDSGILKGLSRSGEQGKGKIKVIKDQEGYNEGFKFQIQDADISLSAGGSQTIVLEEFESYEFKNSKGDYYLERKKSSLEGKWEALGLPEQCRSKFDNTTNGCQMDETDLKNIKFHGKDTTKSITTKDARFWLKTSSDDSLPKGIKVKVEVRGKEVKIPKENNKTMILWKDYETEFRVKDDGKGNYSLEGTVNMNEIVKKFGITNGDCDDELGCTVGPIINIYIKGTEWRKDASVKDKTKKITYRWGDMKSKSFSDDLVFKVPKGGIELSDYGGSNHTKNAGTFNKIKEGTYEIKEYTVGSENNNKNVPYLSKQDPQNYDTKDSFFNY